jgi:hypothetical protein
LDKVVRRSNAFDAQALNFSRCVKAILMDETATFAAGEI